MVSVQCSAAGHSSSSSSSIWGRGVVSILWTGFEEELLSRRDQMIVAWQFIARSVSQDKARPVGNGLSWSTRSFTLKVVEASFRPNHTVPYGTVPFVDTFLAVNCQATFI